MTILVALGIVPATPATARHRDDTRPVKQGFRPFRKGAHVARRA